MTRIDKEHFLAFCSKLKIPSKEGDEEGGSTQLVPFILLPTQLYVLDEIIKAWNKGIRQFVVLKCRQSGITTLGLAMDLYWCFLHRGLVHNFIGDSSKVTNLNRDLCRQFVESLQAYPEWCYQIRSDNSDLMSFSNDSKIIWHVVNTQKKGQLGQSVGMAAAHGTELANWRDEEGAASLTSSLAKKNPNRFFLWESRPGSSSWKKMCQQSQRGIGQQFIFCPWWMQPWYESDIEDEQGLNQFNVYWASHPVYTHEELIWVEGVERMYGHKIRPAQMSWWRNELAQKEQMGMDVEYMHQQYPPLPSYAWRYGQKTYISSDRLSQWEVILEERAKNPKRYYRFDWGRESAFDDLKVTEVDPRESYYQLVAYEDPVPAWNGFRYAIGVDPVHGADERGCDAAVCVLRCHSDQCVQVAEFCQTDCEGFKLAWVILWLAACYNSQPLLNLELQGGGYEVQNEIRKIQNGSSWGYNDTLVKAFDVLGHYIWRRSDQIRPTSTSYHYKMGTDSKEMMLTSIQTYFGRNQADIRSQALLDQLTSATYTLEGDVEIPRPNDRFFAFGLAIRAYQQILETDLGAIEAYSRANFEKRLREASGAQSQEEYLGNMLTNWKDRMILQAREERYELEDRMQKRAESLGEGLLKGWRTR